MQKKRVPKRSLTRKDKKTDSDQIERTKRSVMTWGKNKGLQFLGDYNTGGRGRTRTSDRGRAQLPALAGGGKGGRVIYWRGDQSLRLGVPYRSGLYYSRVIPNANSGPLAEHVAGKVGGKVKVLGMQKGNPNLTRRKEIKP